MASVSVTVVMAAEFILRSLYNKGDAQLQPFLDALAELRLATPRVPDGAKLSLSDKEARAEAIEPSVRQVRGLGEMRIYGVVGAPGDGADVEEIIRWTEQRMKRRRAGRYWTNWSRTRSFRRQQPLQAAVKRRWITPVDLISSLVNDCVECVRRSSQGVEL